MRIYTEVTPNPKTLKFVAVEQTILEKGSVDFPTKEAAEGSNFAVQLFELPYVEGVFIGRNFVTITKADTERWEKIIPEVKELLKNFIESGEAFVNPELLENSQTSENDMEQQIINLIETNVRPAVAMDGGDIVFESFSDGIVKVRLMGSCSGCPSSTITLKNGIESFLKRMIPEVQSVEAV